MTYNDKLERGAQTAVHPGDPSGGEVYGYNSRVKLIVGWGDPQAAAINDAYHKGASGLISNCDFTEFGVGFYRDESLEWDSVSIYFGAPECVAPPASTPVVTPAPAGKQCPVGSPTPTVGIHETCAAPTNQVSVSFVKGLMWTVNATNASNIAGKCTFTVAGPGGGLSDRAFDISANGSASFQVSPPLPFATYTVVTSCHGTFDGKDVEFGHNEQKVSL